MTDRVNYTAKDPEWQLAEAIPLTDHIKYETESVDSERTITLTRQYRTKSIRELQIEIHEWAKARGWWEKDRNFGELLMLITTEVAEAFEEYRDGHEPTEIYYATDKNGQQKPEGIPIELADIFIRLADLCGHYGIDLHSAIRTKMQYNETRPYRHGGKRA